MSHNMVNRELVKTEIDFIQEQYLDILYQFIKTLQKAEINNPRQSSLMSKLKQVKIQAPSDFAKNIDVYLNGEKDVE
jgi:hypothetical protein